jgi:hypothetical protein
MPTLSSPLAADDLIEINSNVIERFWRVLRRRATHNRLFASMAVLRTTLRHNLCYFQTMRQKVLSLMESPRKAKKEAKLAAE